MKKRITLIIIFLVHGIIGSSLFGQITITLQPGSVAGKDALMDSRTPTWNGGSDPEFNSMAWTYTSIPLVQRSMVEFDLSSIPSTAIIQTAYLTLYNNPNSSNGFMDGTHSHYSGSNASLIQRITSSWQENTVTWNTQPGTTNLNEATLPQNTTPNEDYTVTVTALVQDMINNPSTSFGFMLKLVTEQYYRCLVFASSDHPNAALHPKLVITYTGDCTVTTLQPGSVAGKDALMDSRTPTWNGGSDPEFNSMAWTYTSIPLVQRSMVEFDLSSIPSTAIIQTAYLTLYNNPNSSNGFMDGTHSHYSGSNASLIQRITSSWQENTVTWNTQPGTTNLNEATLPQNTTPNEDYTVTVTALVQDMINNPSTSFGFMLKLVTEQYYRCLVFASSDHPNAALHPKLEVCYTNPSSVNHPRAIGSEINIFPNPATNQLTIESGQRKMESIEIYDMLGQKVYSGQTTNNKQQTIDVSKWNGGIYFVKVLGENKEAVIKLIKE